MDDSDDDSDNDSMDDSDDDSDDGSDADSTDDSDAGSDADSTDDSMDDSDDDGRRFFTEEELEQYNGENGLPVYFAYDGIVYDVTHLSGWVSGIHNGIAAGYDLTDDIQYAPHGDEKLENAIIIGILED
jgi:predicted heme/steroid binding protein